MDQDVVPVLLTLRAFAAARDPAGLFAAWFGIEATPYGARAAFDIDLFVSYGDDVFCCEGKKSASA